MDQTQTPHHTRHLPRPIVFLARTISFILHPIFLPTLLCVALYYLTPAAFADIARLPTLRGVSMLWIRLISLVLITVFFPLLAIVLMKALGFIKSIYMRDPKERIIPLIATMTFFFWAYLVYSHPLKMGDHIYTVPPLVPVILFGSFLIIVAIFMVNIFFKISMHATAAGGAIAFGLILLLTAPANMLIPFFLFVIVAGIIGSSRLLLNEHRPSEVWFGYLLGFIVQMVAWFYLR